MTKVSIVTVVYNAVSTLDKTIKSVINQSYQDIEYIVVDGGSTDGSVDLIKRYESKIDYWVSEPDRGISHAFNKGLSHCTGDLIGIINADDWYVPDAVERVVKNLESSCGVYAGNLAMYGHDGKLIKVRKSSFWRLVLGMYIMHPATFVRREVYDSIGGFAEEYKIAMDYDLILRFKYGGVKFKILHETLACLLVGGISSDVKLANNEVYKIMRKRLPYPTYVLSFLFTKLNTLRMSLMNSNQGEHFKL